MQLFYSAEEERFRSEVRQFIRDNLPADLAKRVARGSFFPAKADHLQWHRILARRGWAAIHWPVEYGGTGWTPIQKHIFEDECARADAPPLAMGGLGLVAPVVYTFGTEEQKRRFLGPIREGEMVWAQGFSEPNSGSDLASLRTVAVRGVDAKGEHYVVNGSKIWTGRAHESDYGFFLVRTNTEVKAQKGISFLLIDLKNSPGVNVRPIVTLDGRHHLNQVFLENVRVPAENLVGEEGKGWNYAKFLLTNERTSSAYLYWSRRELGRVREIAAGEIRNGRPLMEDPEFRRKFASIAIELDAIEYAVLRVLTGEKTRYDDIAVASVLKIHGSQVQQKVTELQVEAMGPRALRWMRASDPVVDDSAQHALWAPHLPGRITEYMITRAATIYGGALQVQKNIVSKLAFGL